MKINLEVLANLSDRLKILETDKSQQPGLVSVATLEKMIDYLLFSQEHNMADETIGDDELDLNILIIKNTLIEYGVLSSENVETNKNTKSAGNPKRARTGGTSKK